jgi:hypothetical protein
MDTLHFILCVRLAFSSEATNNSVARLEFFLKIHHNDISIRAPGNFLFALSDAHVTGRFRQPESSRISHKKGPIIGRNLGG